MKILVTGATGSHGSTGLEVVKQLIKENYEVRAMVHHIDQRSDALQLLGCEIIQADFHDLASLRTALSGIDTCFFSYPIQEGIVTAAANFALAAKEKGLKHLVNNSMVVTMDLSPSPFARQSFLAEQIFSWAGISTTNLRSGFFYENLLRYSKDEILNQNKISWPMGSGGTKLAWITSKDVALAASSLLIKKENVSQTLFLTGPDALTFKEVAAICSKILKTTIAYEDANEREFIYNVSKVENNNSTITNHLEGLSKAFRAGKSFGVTTEALKSLTGAEGISFSEFLKQNLK
jgi:uncharacterized protein YbjT (DUF2867 family)